MSASGHFSFELFPPKTPAAAETLRATWRTLGELNPRFFSCTYGAGGSTRDRTLATVLEIHAAAFRVAPHICCSGSTRSELAALLDVYRQAGIRDLVALRGDAAAEVANAGELRHADEFVRFIRETTGDHFHIAVGCYPEYHPEAPSPMADLMNLKSKIDEGADLAITQYFFNADAYFRFVDDCAAVGIDVPIVPGVLPFADVAQLTRFSNVCGAEIPRWLRLKLQSYEHDAAAVQRLGLDVVTDLCDRLLSGGAPGLHFYTLNRAALTATIWRRLGLSSDDESLVEGPPSRACDSTAAA